MVVVLGLAVVGGFRESLAKSLDNHLTRHVGLLTSDLSTSADPEAAVNADADSLTGFYVVLLEDNGVQRPAGGAVAGKGVLHIPLQAWPAAPQKVVLADGTGPTGALRFALEKLPRPFSVIRNGAANVGHSITAVAVGESNQEVADGVSSLIRSFVIFGGITLVIAVFAARWMAGRVSKPVEDLSAAVVRVAQSGDLTTRVSDRSGTPELKQLARSMNSALEHVQQMYEALEKVLIQQRRFIHDASHELRTPLTTVSSTLEALTLLPDMETSQREEIIGGALSEAKRMTWLVNGLLTLAAYDSGEGVTRKSFKFRDVVNASAEYARRTLAPRAVELAADDDLGSGWGDADALRQMLEHSIDNIRDHTPQSTAVRITAAKSGEDAVQLSISDNGPGVSEKLLPTLTSRFVRADTSRTDGKPGLGLSIAEAIAGAHAGTLDLSREKPHGLRVVATIPRGKSAGRPERRRAPRPRNPEPASAT